MEKKVSEGMEVWEHKRRQFSDYKENNVYYEDVMFEVL